MSEGPVVTWLDYVLAAVTVISGSYGCAITLASQSTEDASFTRGLALIALGVLTFVILDIRRHF